MEMHTQSIVGELKDLGEFWTETGHGILFGQVCQLIRENNSRGLLELLSCIERAMPHRLVDRFYESTRQWISSGGHLKAIADQPSFHGLKSGAGLSDYAGNNGYLQGDLATLLDVYTRLASGDEIQVNPVATMELCTEDLSEVVSSLGPIGSEVPKKTKEGFPRPPPIPSDAAIAPSDAAIAPSVTAVHEVVRPAPAPSPGSSPLPSGLVIGVLVMCQALIIFYCLFL